MTVKIPQKAFNPVYRPLLHCGKRYLVLYGGAGSGKSVFAVQRFLIRLMREPLCNLLVVRAVADTNRDSTFALFKQMISRWGLSSLFKINETMMKITCVATGNAAIFKGLDNVEKLKSVTFEKGELTEIWIEEASEIVEEDFNQLDIRLRGKGISGQIVLSFNPVSMTHWLKQRFFDRVDPKAEILKTTYRDNRFLTREYQQLLEGFKESDPYYYRVYCLGEWGVLGKTIFDAQKVAQRLEDPLLPIRRGEFTYQTYYDSQAHQIMIDDSTIRFIDLPDGAVMIYEDPQPDIPYVIGGDTAGEGSDWFCGQVIDNVTGKQVCTLRQQFDEDIYARQMYCLGRYYHNALIAIEANFSSYPIKELERLGYAHQYIRESEDNYTHKPKQAYGFKTTTLTRPLIIAGLVEVVRDHTHWLYDRETLSELLTFVRNERGKAEAEAGAHDDCVMALAIAYYARGQQNVLWRTRAAWTDDMKQDYRKAKPAEKEMLMRKWGMPHDSCGE